MIADIVLLHQFSVPTKKRANNQLCYLIPTVIELKQTFNSIRSDHEKPTDMDNYNEFLVVVLFHYV